MVRSGLSVGIGAYCEVAKDGQQTSLWERSLMVHPTQDKVRWVAHKQPWLGQRRVWFGTLVAEWEAQGTIQSAGLIAVLQVAGRAKTPL